MSDLEDGKSYTSISAEIAANDLGERVIRGAEGLNQKTSALLTHVSIMVAVAMVFLFNGGRDRTGAFDVFLVTEIYAYLFICIVCLTTIWTSSNSTYKRSKLNHVDRLIQVTTWRRKRFKIALILTIVVTIAFMGNLVLLTTGGHPTTLADIEGFAAGAWKLLSHRLPAG